MKKFLMLIVILAGLATAGYRFLPVDAQQNVNLEIADESPSLQPKDATGKSLNSDLANAYRQHLQDIQVEGEGEVVKVLADDTKGSRHQRFILRVPEGFTVLVAHNIDLAPRVENISQGDKISFYGEYVWNEKGGVIHWTHHDPRGRHVAGWLKHNGITYQ
jgi:hypothetical protein